jgi:hypothetical protein
MKFEVNADETKATLLQAYTYDKHLGTAMGSMQVLGNGNVLVGWGTDPAVTEFTSTGKAVYEASLGGISYRSYRHEWTARPTSTPDIAARPEGDGMRIYASWNGATKVKTWRFLASDTGEPAPVGEVKPSGFETSLLTTRAGRVAVQALDATGKVLGSSKTIAA